MPLPLDERLVDALAVDDPTQAWPRTLAALRKSFGATHAVIARQGASEVTRASSAPGCERLVPDVALLGPAMGAPPGEAATATAPPATSFVPVTLSLPSTPASTLPRPGTIEIVVAGGRMVRVGSDVDTVALVRIVEALEARR